MQNYLNEIYGIADAICATRILQEPFLTRKKELEVRNEINNARTSDDIPGAITNPTQKAHNMIKSLINDIVNDPTYLQFITLSFSTYDENDTKNPVGLQQMTLLDFSYYYYNRNHPDMDETQTTILTEIARQFAENTANIFSTELISLLGKNSDEIAEMQEKRKERRSGIDL